VLQAWLSIAILTRDAYDTVKSSPTIYVGNFSSFNVFNKWANASKSFSSNGSSIDMIGYFLQRLI